MQYRAERAKTSNIELLHMEYKISIFSKIFKRWIDNVRKNSKDYKNDKANQNNSYKYKI